MDRAPLRSRISGKRMTYLPAALFLFSILGVALGFSPIAHAAAALTITPITWNTIGLDSNNVNVGPNDFPVGARVCNTGDVAATNVVSNLIWDSVDPYIDYRPGSLPTLSLSSLAAGSCTDFYYEVEITRDPAAYNHTRQYHIDAVSDTTALISTPTPREIFVEHLISQHRNGITDVKLDGVSVPAGGSMNLIVGNTYTIEMDGFTATQGYNQLESFIHFPNTIFQVLAVSTTYTADDNTSTVPNPNSTQYANACVWDNDPNSPTYRNCIGNSLDKAGGTVDVTYTVKIISFDPNPQTLNTLLYDFSGSSYHYNSDFATGARIANIINPGQFPISKGFSPSNISINGISTLTITVGNPTGASVSGYNFTDPLPTHMAVANPPNASTSGCGTPTFAPAANDTSLSFSDGTVAAGGNCTITVNVVVDSTPGTLTNTTDNLFIGASDTTNNATAFLGVQNAPPPGSGGCAGVTMAQWVFTNFTTDPPPFPAADTQAGDVATAAISVGGTVPGPVTAGADGSTGNPLPSIRLYGWEKNGPIVTSTFPFIQFQIDTSNYTGVQLNFDAQAKPNGPTNMLVYESSDGSTFSLVGSSATTTSWASYGPFSLTNGTQYFRIYTDGANNPNSGADLNLDNITFTGAGPCAPATIAKAFSLNPIKVGGVSTLTFTLTNPNPSNALNNATFTDNLPPGVVVAATPNAVNNCGGGTWAPAAADNTLFLSGTGATIPAGGSCTLSVDVTATSAGAHVNTSGYLTTDEGGTNTESVATDNLLALVPPDISKHFAPNPILPNGISTLTFTITNLNQNDAISGVAFGDTFPTTPDNMVVAAAPNTTTNCGGTVTATAGTGSMSFSGGSIAGGGTCTVTVDVTAPTASVTTYDNTSDKVSFVINTETVFGNKATDSLTVTNPTPAIGITKQVSTSASGPWSSFVAVPVGANVYYRFVIENTGDVPLDPVSITDNTLDVSTCNSGWTTPLPVASPSVDATETCIVGPITAVAGSNSNTAKSHGTYNATNVDSLPSTAVYATTDPTLDKSVTETKYIKVGDILHYSYLVTNAGFAPLQGPVTIADNKLPNVNDAAPVCPAVTTVGDGDNFLDPGESITCTATYTVTAADITAGSVTNTATATVGGVESNQDTTTVRKSPTAVDTSPLTAKINNAESVILKWRTLSESKILGFNIYRRVGKGAFKQINTDFISAKHPGDPGGFKYRFKDSITKSGKIYRYKIEIVYSDLHSEWSNVIRIETPKPNPIPTRTP